MFFKLRIQIFDSASPSLRTEVQVQITVQRNTNPPVFASPSYNAQIADTVPIGSRVVTVAATDRDGTQMRYTLLGNAAALQYFYVVPTTGDVVVTKALTGSTDTAFTVSTISYLLIQY